MSLQNKEDLVAQFRAYLESHPASVEQTADADRQVDLFTLFTELAALKNEIRIESRQVKEALDRFRQLLDSVGESNRQLSLELERRRGQARGERRESERPLLLELLDLRDRMEDGMSSAREYRPSFYARLKGAPERYIAELADGMAITLRRVEAALSRYKVEPVGVVNQQLDPHTMRACGVERRTGLAEGVVLSEVRKGFLRDGEVLRLAEVIVNKNGPNHE